MAPASKLPQRKKILIAVGIFMVPTVIIVIVIVLLTHRKNPSAAKQITGTVFNTALPSPNLPKGEHNKLEIYMKAQQDSLKAKQDRAKDPYGQPGTNLANPTFSEWQAITGKKDKPALALALDANEQKVNERLQKIYAALGQATPTPATGGSRTMPWSASSSNTEQLDRFERMFAAIQSRDTSTNPQLDQVNKALDKILAIQHPAQPIHSADTILSTTTKASTQAPAVPPDFPGTQPEDQQNGFFGSNDDPDTATQAPTSMLAVVHNTQTIVAGSIVKLRLLQDIFIGAQRIPANSFLFGQAAINGERINIQLSNISYGEKIYPLALKVFDASDGLEGIFVPGMITRDVVKQNMSQNVSGLSIGALDPSLGAQAASAGIETAKNLLSRKVRLVRATLKEGHVVILRPATQNN